MRHMTIGSFYIRSPYPYRGTYKLTGDTNIHSLEFKFIHEYPSSNRNYIILTKENIYRAPGLSETT